MLTYNMAKYRPVLYFFYLQGIFDVYKIKNRSEEIFSNAPYNQYLGLGSFGENGPYILDCFYMNN